MSRRHFLTIPILIFFLCMLSFPQTVFAGASYGLLLWFRYVLPTLLPYMVLINILIRTPALHWICHITSPFLCPLLGTSYYGTFEVLTGLACSADIRWVPRQLPTFWTLRKFRVRKPLTFCLSATIQALLSS